MPVEEHKGIQSSILSRRRHTTLGRKKGQERLDLGFAHLFRMSFVVQEDEPLDPMDIGLLRAHAVVSATYDVPYLV